MKQAYFDCFSGISGDMILGALLDLGVPEGTLRDALSSLPLSDYSLKIWRENRGSLSGVRVKIDHGPQPARTLEDIRKLIEASSLSGSVRGTILAVFQRLAAAEAHVHQTTVDKVHFHEVGAVDSILDVVGAIVCLNFLEVDRVFSSPLPLGGGFVKSDHGLLPVPAPATLLLLENTPLYDNGVHRELVTPTGAAVITTVAESFGAMPAMRFDAVGYGAGSHTADNPPNLLRVMLGTSCDGYVQKDLLLLEANIDDMNPELYDHLFQKLFALGALDVHLAHVHMKKNRPGILLRILLEPSLRDRALETVFLETTTLGIRAIPVQRHELRREVLEVRSPLGLCRVKKAFLPGGGVRALPEYEDCKRIAIELHRPLREVYDEIVMFSRNKV